MKIIYGITKSNFGGAQRYVFDLAREANKAGHDVAVLCGGEGSLINKLKEESIRVISLPHLKRDISLTDELRSLHFIFRTLVEEKPDVFHTNSSKMGGLGNFAANLAGIKRIIFTAHGWAFNEPRPSYQKFLIKFFVWLTIMLADKTICVSAKTCRDISGWPFMSRFLTVVPNGIDDFELLNKSEARATLGLPQEAFIVGSLAELHPIKGLDVLIKAWERFSKNQNAKLVVFGEGEERLALEELIKELGLSDSITLKGFIPEAKKYLKAFDIFALPSRSEALPYTVLEAGLAGLPVIASRVGGIPEVIETGVSGALVEPENNEELLSTLLLLSQDGSLRERLGSALKARVASDFSLSKMASATFQLYR
jgi:glycosyltransferase involved in cell wall biosynthesis